MKGSESKLIKLMQGAGKRFVIPVYQRNYDWKIENCKQLYDDLIIVVRNKRKSHFFGSIVSVHNPDGDNEEYLVIDGQQRLTTVSLLFIAMHNILNAGIIVSNDNDLANKINEEYLIDKWKKDETRIKLKSIKEDSIAYSRLFQDKSDHISVSNITINYEYFYDRIQKREISIDELYDAICCLEIINITLNQDDNPQLIFESLNSTGVALTEGDKIRNFILMGLPTDKQNLYYERYWNKIELCTDYNVSAFVRDYLSVKQQFIPAKSRVYITFKAYVDDNNFDTEELLIDLLDYAKSYEILIKGNTGNTSLDACIYRLNRLETSVTRPFFLEVLRLMNEEQLDINQVDEIFLITENYLFRRTICGLPTNSLNKIFLLLHREIMRFDNSANQYVEKLKYALRSKRENARFPEDKEFREEFSERQVYLMNSKNKIYILERLENYNTAEDKDVYRHFDDGNYSIEHIMPQHLTPAWAESLGSGFEETHEKWLHRLANLTLTAYNSKYSNYPFADKKTMKHGLIDSGLRLNTYFGDVDEWGEQQLEERNHHLMARALEIWNLPETSFRPTVKQMDSVTLDEAEDLTGRKIARFSFKNIEQPVESWVAMYESVLKILHSEDKLILKQLSIARDDDNDLIQYVSRNEADLREPMEIEADLYVEKHSSTSLKISLLRRFFKLYSADPEDLVFYLREDFDSDRNNITSPRSDLLYKYWNYALPYIHESHGKEGSFKNVKQSKDNSVVGSFGIGGFGIYCVANQANARVELILSSHDTKRNREAFDKLYQHKVKVENKLGAKLYWDRGDHQKRSKISIENDNLSVQNESDWQKLASYHATWSKKFYDVLVPYLV